MLLRSALSMAPIAHRPVAALPRLAALSLDRSELRDISSRQAEIRVSHLSAFAANGSPTLNPYTNPKQGYVQQYNLDVQRQVGWGWFLDAAYAGSHGVHLENFNPSVNINQIPDSFIAQAATQYAPGLDESQSKR